MTSQLTKMRIGVLLASAASVLPLAGLSAPGRPVKPAVGTLSLVAAPQRVALSGKYAEARVLASTVTADGRRSDVSGRIVWTIKDPKVATLDEDGMLRPRHDGKTVLIGSLDGRTLQVPVEARGVDHSAPPRFLSDVMPVISRAGCNAGSCHGAGQGKGGFKLSLQGYDPDADYDAITRGALGRRVARTQPENSLLLKKPAMQVAHKGGLRFKAGSAEYRLVRDWIAAGMPGPNHKEPAVVKLEVTPPGATLGMGGTQRFIVRARYSDGSTRDATPQTVFTASDESVAKVSFDGEATVTGNGEGAVLVRYQGLVTAVRVMSPFAVPRKWSPGPKSIAARSDSHVQIDGLVDQKLAALGLPESSRSTDYDFLRRVYLDVIGLLPTPDETRAFLADKAPDRRAKLIDALLDRPEYVDSWSLKWGDLLRSSRKTLSDKGMSEFNFWIRESVRANKPWDQFVREIVLSGGSPYEVGPANFYRTATTPETMAETTSQAFLGVRMQCARCHNHPYERWTQNQYYEMAAFFARVKSHRGASDKEQLVLAGRNGEVKHLRTKNVSRACALDAQPIPADYSGDRREVFADWLTSARNPFFSRVLVNRIWRHYMGRGLVEPVDDMRVTNPPSNEPLLDFLASDFASHGFDLKRLMRSIMLTRAYQRSAEPVKGNDRDTKYYSHYAFKRLSAEQMSDAISSATGVSEKFAGYPVGLHASQLPDSSVGSYFLELFGKPARNITCECERSDDPNLGQVLHLMNNTGLNAKVADKNGRVAKLIAAKITDDKLVEELYLASFSRYPLPDEQKRAVKILSTAKNRQQTAEDLLWTLVNSKEFIFNH